MDALSAVLAPVRLQKTAWAYTVGRAPWGVALPTSKRCVRFHYVLRGSVWLGVDKTEDRRVALSGGDLAVLPLGHGHTLRDQPRSGTERFDELVRCAARPGSVVVHLDVGAGGPTIAQPAVQLGDRAHGLPSDRDLAAREDWLVASQE